MKTNRALPLVLLINKISYEHCIPILLYPKPYSI
jgi:hypothetical protein